MADGLEQLAKGIGKAVEAVPGLYEDTLQLSAQESGKLIGRIPRAINAAFSGLDKWILNREFSVEETKKLLAIKLANIEPKKIVAPEAYVAIPTIQAISYSMDSEELRNLYANLLAKSMISDSRESVHPSFVEIIKQMSPMDANIFSLIFESNVRPLINLQKRIDSGGVKPIQYHCSWIQTFSINQVATSIDNLIRLGLIEIPYGESYTDTSIYDTVVHNPLVAPIIRNNGLEYESQYMKITDLSTLFYNICVLSP